MTEAHVAKSITRRVESARKALYVFGIGAPELAGKRWTVERITIIAIPFRKHSLLLRYVDASEWSGPALEAHRRDRTWLCEQARFHERVLSRVMRRGAVVPVRFCTVFDSFAHFEDASAENYQRWRRALLRLSGKFEWRLRVYEGPHAVPAPEPYPLGNVAGDAARPASLRVTGAVADHLARLWKSCGALATAARTIEGCGERCRVFEAVFLLPDQGIPKFHEALGRWALSAKPLGLTYYFEGPRPPFTFA